MRRTRLLGAASLFQLVLLAGPVAGQGFDYGALEQLFGEPITTSATGRPQRVSEVPVSMDIITAEQIRRSGAHDLPGVLARYTSLDVQQYNAHDYTVAVRGYATAMNQRLLVLINGRQVYLDHNGYTAWNAIPVQLAEIRQIEVVKGPNSALYGFNAAAGVINIVTYDPLHDQISRGTLRIGAGGYREGSGVVSAPLGVNGGLRLSAGLREERPWRRGHTEFEATELDSRRNPSQGQLAAEALYRIADGVILGLDGSYGRAIGGNFFNYGQFWREDTRVWSMRGRVSADTQFGLLEASVFHNGYRGTFASTAFATDQGITVVQISDTVKLGTSHVLRPLFEYRRSVQEAAPGQRLGYRVVAGGGMWNWSITDAIQSTAALRYDHLWLDATGFNDPRFPYGDRDYDRPMGRLSWNLGLVWRPSDHDTLRLSAARGVALPSLADLGYRDSYPEFGYQDTGSPRLGPMVVDDAQLGYRRRVDAINGHLGATVFHQQNRGFSSGLSVVTLLPPVVPYPTYVPLNLGTSHATGLELSAAGRIGDAWRWGAEYRYVSVQARFDTSRIDYKGASPNHLLTARLGWTGGGWEVDGFARYASRTQGYRVVDATEPVHQTVSGFVSGHLRIARRLTDHLTLALEGENLLQQYQRQTLALHAERRVFLSLHMEF